MNCGRWPLCRMCGAELKNRPRDARTCSARRRLRLFRWLNAPPGSKLARPLFAQRVLDELLASDNEQSRPWRQLARARISTLRAVIVRLRAGTEMAGATVGA
jgi:hypothetical protein